MVRRALVQRVLLAIAITVFAAVGAKQASGQTLVGVKAGLNFSSLSVEDQDNPGSKTGFVGGAFAQIPLGAGSWAFQPELLYSQEGAKDTDGSADVKINVNYIRIPLLIEYLFSVEGQVVPVLFAGPSLGIRTGCKLSGSDGGVSVDIDCNEFDFDVSSFDLGLQFGGGVHISTGRAIVTLDARYSLGLLDVNDTADVSQSLKNKGFTVLAGVGIPVH